MQSWECQGRQEHGQFGSGTCVGLTTAPVADCPSCATKAAAYTVVGLLPRSDRAQYETWLNSGGLRKLEQTVPGWAADAHLDAETFRQAHFGPDGSVLLANAAQQFGAFFSSDATGAAGRAAMAAALLPLVRTASPRREITPRPAARPVPTTQGLSQKWMDTVDRALRDPRSNAYDFVLDQEIADYTQRLGGTPGFWPLDRRLFKAMLLVETGPERSEWTTRPIQIGNAGDPGLGVLRSGRDGAALVMNPGLAHGIEDHLSRNNGAFTDPQLNVRAGIAYALTRMVHIGQISRIDPPDQSRHLYIVQPGESLSRISQILGTTMDNLRQNNPGVGDQLRPGDTIGYQRAVMVSLITGWRDMTPTSLMDRYNGNRDAFYARKIQYVLDRLPR
jgi:LysM domain